MLISSDFRKPNSGKGLLNRVGGLEGLGLGVLRRGPLNLEGRNADGFALSELYPASVVTLRRFLYAFERIFMRLRYILC